MWGESVPFLAVTQYEENTSASPAELQRARSGSDGTGLSPLTMPAALAAKRPTRSRVGLHEDGCLAVVVHEAPESAVRGPQPRTKVVNLDSR